MAIITKQMYVGAAATSSATLYTVPSATTAVVTGIVVANTAGSSGTFTIATNGTVIFPAVTIAANTTYTIDLKQVLNASQTVTGFASATTINFSINGTEQA